MKTSIITITLLASLSLGCKSQSNEEPEARQDQAAAVQASASTPAATEPAAATSVPGAMAAAQPAGLGKADAATVQWLRAVAKCDLKFTTPTEDEPRYSEHWSFDECESKHDDARFEIEDAPFEAAMLDALGDDDRNVRLIAARQLPGFAERGQLGALGMLVYMAGHEPDPYVGAELAYSIERELKYFEGSDDPSKGKPFALALTDALSRSTNEGLFTETEFNCEFSGCEDLWIRASRTNPSAKLRVVAHDLARGSLDDEAGCALTVERLTKEEDVTALTELSEWMGRCDEAHATALVTRVEKLGIEGPGAAQLWDAIDQLSPSDPKLEAKLEGWAKTIVDKKLGTAEIREHAEFRLP